jgi:aminopeptidase N
VDGIKAGVHFEGDYLYTLHKIDATIWWNTHALQETAYESYKGEGTYLNYKPINYSFNYVTPVTRNMPRLQLQLNSRYLDGGWYQRGGFNWLMTDKNIVQLYAQSMWRDNSYEYDYLIDPNDWSSSWQRPNTSLNFAWGHNYNYISGIGKYMFSLRAPFLNGTRGYDFNYSYAQLESVNYNYIGKLEVRTRLFGRYGMGTRLPYESALYMAGASPEEEMDNKYTRSIGFIPDKWEDISRYDVNHFQQGGGLNLRGYAGYFAPDERNGNLMEGYKGRSGASANVEVDFENYMPWHPRHLKWLHANVYAFGDAGVMQLSYFSLPNYYNITPNTTYWSNVHVDAGVGFAFTIKNWGVFEKAKPLTFRVDFPVFLNRPPYSNDQYATLRYVIGVNRAF